MKSKKINCLVIGMGKVGLTQHIPAMLGAGNFELTACVTRSKKRWQEAKKSFPNTRWRKNLNELIKEEKQYKTANDLAIICTPSDLHLNESMLLLKHGYNLLIEKPVTLNTREALKIKEAAKQKKKKIFVYQCRHYDPDFLFLKKFVSSGKLGRAFHIEIHCYSPFGPDWGDYGVTNWRIAGKAGGMLYDWGPHMFEEVMHLFPEGVETVYAKLQNLGNFKKVDDHDFIHFITKKKRQAFIYLSNLCPALYPHWLIMGEKAVLRSNAKDYWDWNNFTLYTVKDGNAQEKKLKPEKQKYNTDTLFYRDLYRELTGKRGSLKVTYDDAIEAMKLIDAAFLSSKNGKPVRL